MFKVICKITGETKEVFHVKEDDTGIWFLVFTNGSWSYDMAYNYLPIKF